MPNESWTADRYKQEMRCLSHRRRPDRIATVHWLNGSLRLTIWGPDGPHYHLTFANTEELERELRHDWRDDPEGIRKWQENHPHILTIGVYLGDAEDEIAAMRGLFKHLVVASSSEFPTKLGNLLRSLRPRRWR